MNDVQGAMPHEETAREPGERVRDGDWFHDSETLFQITRNSVFRWFIGQPVKKQGIVFPNKKDEV
jgi:hypothetical protein